MPTCSKTRSRTWRRTHGGINILRNGYGVSMPFPWLRIFRGINMGMIKFEELRFRKRYWNYENSLAIKLNLISLSFNELLKLRKKLNNSNYKSEIWFKKLLFNRFIDFKVKCYLNYPILNRFFCDFYFREYKIAIEVDGSSHIGKEEYDRNRDELFRKSGITIFRIKAFDETSAELVLEKVYSIILNTNRRYN